MDTIDSLLGEADQAWRAYGVGSADRAALGADLRLDLRAAAADGGDPVQMLGDDVAGFARRLADEAGVRRVRRDYGRLLSTALIGAVLGAVLGYGLLIAVYPIFVRIVDIPRSIHVPIHLAVAVYYGVPAAVVAAGAVIAVRTRLPDLPRIRRTARIMSVLIPAAGILVTPITMAFAWSTDYSTAPEVVATEFAMVLATLAGATVLARRLSLREGRAASDTSHPDATVIRPV
ncbi:hypothetical protein [Micromonospora parathelypteridis]|uniref:Uncharacterized protein n=1 Tax=Micromonospora parathelypteridis TaxID=1839617 RepID=A0A840VQL0_9ACTN|nr:hypothetical protein [Micromonospora parathelypteridis]MBB5476304.1 hypothetical protein [Micromonospora parathelypteridis]GGO14504.1 hypothetical protein GCM10011576_25550 [Micromonospora parathelypteridis]